VFERGVGLRTAALVPELVSVFELMPAESADGVTAVLLG
jgi:hypothetical protein